MENKSRRAAVLGHPISHSLSPRLHHYWLKQYHLEGSYEAIETQPSKLAHTLNALEREGYAGVNLTVPLKETVLSLLDKVDPAARRIGAVNTVIFTEGRRVGYNTDAYGFRENLRHPGPGKAVILGAGGAARSIITALLEDGYDQIVLCNRTFEKAQMLAREFACGAVAWEHRAEVLAGCSLLVNSTSLGMQGQPPLEISLEKLPSTAVVTDIVYSPLETDLLKAARAKGNRVVDGLGMLLYQGQKAFELFFGLLPEVSAELRKEILSRQGDSA